MNADWLKRDAASVWHPFTQTYYSPENLLIERGNGAWFYDTEGRAYLDAIASWWVNLHGHCNSYIAARVIQQVQQLEHSIFAAFTHKPGIELAERLLSHLPGFGKVFFSDNGSTAVEVAIKMALQYWSNTGKAKYKILAFADAYHGDTFGGMSVAARNAFNSPFEPLLFDVLQLPLPTDLNIKEVLKAAEQHLKHGDVAAFIFEPLVLGAGGMLMYQAIHLDRLLALCRKYNCLTIADEVMTGFGRTGKFFAIDHLEQRPDIVCMSKGITGGFFPLGATACRQQIFEAFISADKYKTFFHGHSYTGNPVACAAAIASLHLTERPETWEAIRLINNLHQQFALEITDNSNVENVRVTGTILAMDVSTEEATGYLNSKAESLAAFFIQRNIILRPLGNVLYVLPPYCITTNELEMVYDAIRELLR